jgi:hypothetical protein
MLIYLYFKWLYIVSELYMFLMTVLWLYCMLNYMCLGQIRSHMYDWLDGNKYQY